MNHWSTFMMIMVTAIISSSMIANIDGLVYNICTSDGPHGIDSLLPQNLSFTGVKIEILKTNPTGSLNIQVSSDKKIQDIILWAEFRGESHEEQHIGTFDPIAGHAYVEGCNGPHNSTITNYEGFANTSQIIYEWNPPSGSKIIFSRDHHANKKASGRKHHHHKESCPEDKEKHNNHHKKHKKHKKPDHKKHHSNSLHSFTFKGVALLEDDPFKFHVFALNEPIRIHGNITSDAFLITSSTSPTIEGEGTNNATYVGSFDDTTSETSNLHSKWNRMEVMILSFLVAGMLIL